MVIKREWRVAVIVVEGIEEIVERGYAFHHEVQLEGVKPVGGPVTGPDGRVIRAFSMGRPTNRMQGDRFEKELL